MSMTYIKTVLVLGLFANLLATDAEPIAPRVESIDLDELQSALLAKDNFRKHAPTIQRGLVGSHMWYRAQSAQWFIQHGNMNDVPHLIAALSDESAHKGANYPVAGMATTRYWANVALIAICGTSYEYRWDDPPKKREYAISLWTQHWERQRGLSTQTDSPNQPNK